MPENTTPQSSSNIKQHKHEQNGVDVRTIVIVGAALAFVVILVVIIAGVMDHYLSGREKTPNPQSAVPQPHLQAQPLAEIDRLNGADGRNGEPQ
jgi:hypothetical protein